jgi:ornithine cyclodeaminase/alanine dehydrogenase
MVFPNNRDRGIDTIQAIYILLDPETGVPLAFMDGQFLTAIRTSATSALATQYMASGGKKRLAVFGAGVQAEFHIAAMVEVAEVIAVAICSRDRDRAARLASRVRSAYRLPCEVTTANNAVERSNLICTCSSSNSPVFDGRAIQPGTHINAIGTFTPDSRELDTETVRRGRLVIDAESAAGREAGDVLIPIGEGAIDATHVKGSLADLVSEKVPGRESDEEITIFKSCGVAIEDLVTAQCAYRKALELGVGTQLDF